MLQVLKVSIYSETIRIQKLMFADRSNITCNLYVVPRIWKAKFEISSLNS